jgi:hypothetical protein
VVTREHVVDDTRAEHGNASDPYDRARERARVGPVERGITSSTVRVYRLNPT